MNQLVIPSCTAIWQGVHHIPGWFAEDELRALTFVAAVALKNCAGALLEIGSYKGRASIALAKTVEATAPGRMIYALDPGTGDWVGEHDDHWDALNGYLAAAGVSDKITCIRCSPTLENLQWSESLAFVLFDGAHGLREVRRDFDLICTHVEAGGIAAIHDDSADFPGVAMHCQQIERRYRWDRLFKVGTLSFFQKRKV